MMKLKDNPIIYLFRVIWRFSKGTRYCVVKYFTLFTLANLVKFLEPLLIAFALNKIQLEGIHRGNLMEVIFLLSLFIVLNITFWSFHGPGRVIETKNAFLVRANFKKYLLDGTMDLKPEWHRDHHSGDTIDKIEKACSSLYTFSCRTFEIIESLILFISSFLALTYFDFSAAFILVFMMAITSLIILKFDKVLIRQWAELFRNENKISAAVFDALSNITTVIILRIEKLVSKSIFTKIMHPFKLTVRSSKVNELKWFLVSLCGASMTFLVISSYLYKSVMADQIVLIGTIYALYGYIQRINDTFFRFAYLYGDISKAKTAIVNSEEISREFQKKKTSGLIKFDKKWKELKIEQLKFSYHTADGADLHLDDISLTIKRGERIALIGESGSGKTTFLKVMRELFKPNHLKLSLDGALLTRGFKSISSQIALIPQDPEIFNTTIKENITVGVEHKLNYIKKFTDMARLTPVIEKLPQQFNASMVEKGVSLSGGQKQRLALARGLMACEDKEIILLDEPTSSVDFKNELQIYKNIFRVFRSKTIISSIHRLHLLKMFDRIYFFKAGTIIASGSFDELLENSKDFKKLWEKHHKHQQL